MPGAWSASGTGVAILTPELSAESVRAAIERIGQPAVSERARALAATLRGRDGALEAAEAVLRLCALT